jgi:TetR/AcrR family transcriptional regulator, fatty acid metabolism regulator protein
MDYLKRRDSFVLSAIEVLDQLGVQGLTTRALARREGVSEPAFYRQFGSKDDIILALVEEFAKYDDYIINTVQENHMEPEQGLFYFVDAFSNYYQGYPQILSVIFSVDVYRYIPEANQKMGEVLKKRYAFIKNLIQDGHLKKQLQYQISVAELADIVSGLIWAMTYQWKHEDTTILLKDKIKNALRYVLKL